MKLHSQRLQNLAEIRAFLAGTAQLDFEVPCREEAYGWMKASLRQLRYLELSKADKGAVKQYLEKVSGFSRPQIHSLKQQAAADRQKEKYSPTLQAHLRIGKD